MKQMHRQHDESKAVDLECRLTIGHRSAAGGCDCVQYFTSRRLVLVPEVVKYAESIDGDAVDEFARYARGVHQRHLAGLSLAVSA